MEFDAILINGPLICFLFVFIKEGIKLLFKLNMTDILSENSKSIKTRLEVNLADKKYFFLDRKKPKNKKK